MIGTLAQAAGRLAAGWSLEKIFIAILIVAGAVGIVYVILRVVGVQIPPWLIQVLSRNSIAVLNVKVFP